MSAVQLFTLFILCSCFTIAFMYPCCTPWLDRQRRTATCRAAAARSTAARASRLVSPAERLPPAAASGRVASCGPPGRGRAAPHPRRGRSGGAALVSSRVDEKDGGCQSKDQRRRRAARWPRGRRGKCSYQRSPQDRRGSGRRVASGQPAGDATISSPK